MRRAAVVLVLVGLLVGCSKDLSDSKTTQYSAPSSGLAVVGQRAPDFTVETVDGSALRLSTERTPILLSFVDSDETSEYPQTPSRAQIVVLRSMATQYKGLRIVIADPTEGMSKDALTNFAYDWNLTDIPIMAPATAPKIGRLYGVTHTPTTFLIDQNQQLRKVWSGRATSQDISLVLQNELALSPQ